MYNRVRDRDMALFLRAGGTMPVYDYRCMQCGHRFDMLRSVSARDDVKCPKCGGDVARVYEGKWSSLGRVSGGGCSCGGNCQGCSGCGR